MTEQEWLTCADPQKMLEFLRGKVSKRKLGLFVGHCRLSGFEAGHLRTLSDHLTEQALDNATTGLASEDDLTAGRQISICAVNWALFQNAEMPPYLAGSPLVRRYEARLSTRLCKAKTNESGRQRHLLHCIFGNPFRSVTVNPIWPIWLSSAVQNLANAIYSDRTFDRMPVLADALQDAGCDNQDILKHCREPGEHCKGCWCLDLLLGKE